MSDPRLLTSETLAIFRDLADTDSRIRGVTTQRAAAIEPLLDHIDALTGENERLRRELSVIDQGMHKALVEERAALKEWAEAEVRRNECCRKGSRAPWISGYFAGRVDGANHLIARLGEDKTNG